ncbi:eceptor kinase-like protein [Corchorus olitorius]|uniref:Eceptor kinase-like protein n=1 Tax=Corchorus olitorius TaxID=93759 RepID=A0A1R3IL88_9ROSI|nr:eceptor kinase-like protein [Corchorus olitorius]
MTPTATVCLMSLTTKQPSGGYSEKVSTTMGAGLEEGVVESLLFLGGDSVGGFQCGVFLWVELLVHTCEMSWPL